MISPLIPQVLQNVVSSLPPLSAVAVDRDPSEVRLTLVYPEIQSQLRYHVD